MLTNKILRVILDLLSFIVIPVQFVTRFVLGLLNLLTFDLFSVIVSIIWTVIFLGPLLGLSYLYEKLPISRFLVSIVGIPWTAIADTFIILMPTMGEIESRWSKMLLCETFPYSYEMFRVQLGKQELSQHLKTIILQLGPTLTNYAINVLYEETAVNTQSGLGIIESSFSGRTSRIVGNKANKFLAIFGIMAYILTVISTAENQEGMAVMPISLIVVSSIATFIFAIFATIKLWKQTKKLIITYIVSGLVYFVFSMIPLFIPALYGNLIIIILGNLANIVNFTSFILVLIKLFIL
ncbi:MAG: hypothetical protein QXJ06_03140 [Candidatus Aenigmatarchaeota archaeon]